MNLLGVFIGASVGFALGGVTVALLATSARRDDACELRAPSATACDLLARAEDDRDRYRKALWDLVNEPANYTERAAREVLGLEARR